MIPMSFQTFPRTVRLLTGPIKSGIVTSINATFPKTKKNPMRVTMFGASHSGSSSTTAFHWPTSALSVFAFDVKVGQGAGIV